MTDPGYNLVEIVDAVRRAGNPQIAALEALADTDGLTDAVLLDALGVEQWSDLPTTPYPDAPGKAPNPAPARAGKMAAPRKKPGPRPGSRRKTGHKAKAPTRTQPAPSASGTLREELGRTADMLDDFSYAWSGILTDPKGPFTTDQVEALAQISDTARIFLNGWDAAIDALDKGVLNHE